MVTKRKIVYHATGRITANGVELSRIKCKLTPGEARALDEAIGNSFNGKVASLRYSPDYFPIDVIIYSRETPPPKPRTEVNPDLFA